MIGTNSSSRAISALYYCGDELGTPHTVSHCERESARRVDACTATAGRNASPSATHMRTSFALCTTAHVSCARGGVVGDIPGARGKGVCGGEHRVEVGAAIQLRGCVVPGETD